MPPRDQFIVLETGKAAGVRDLDAHQVTLEKRLTDDVKNLNAEGNQAFLDRIRANPNLKPGTPR